jgi:hypothetical protein
MLKNLELKILQQTGELLLESHDPKCEHSMLSFCGIN